MAVASVVPATFLRNGWYTWNQHEVTAAREHASSPALSPQPSRNDYAEAAALLTGTGHDGQAYEPSSDKALTYADCTATAQHVGALDLHDDVF